LALCRIESKVLRKPALHIAKPLQASSTKMKKYLVVFILFLVATSCLKDNTKDVQISNDFKIDFLNHILSDTINLKIILSKEQLISNKSFLPPPHLSIDPENPFKTVNEAEYISNVLEIDTLFVKKQFKSNKTLDLNRLSDYGFRIYDLRLYLLENDFPFNIVEREIDSLNKGKKSYGLFSITKPIFNERLNLAYVRLGNGVAGKTLILENKNGKWEINCF